MAEIRDRSSLKEWLSERQSVVSVAIANRVALRVLPALNGAFGQSNRDVAQDIILPLFRAMAMPWVAASLPTHGIEAKHFQAAATAAATADAATAAYAAAYATADAAAAYATADAAAANADAAANATADAAAAYATADAAAANATAATAAANADAAANANAAAAATAAYAAAYATADAAAANADAAAAAMWQEVESDCDAVQSYADADGGLTVAFPVLHNRKLWRDEALASLFLNQKGPLFTILLGLNDDWEVWDAWYKNRLSGNQLSDDEELCFVNFSEDEWEKGPKYINREIRRRLAEIRAKMNTPQPTDEVDAKIPGQHPASVRAVWRDGKVALSPDSAEFDLDTTLESAELRAMVAEFEELADDISDETNLDKRPAAYLQKTAKLLINDPLDNPTLFRLAKRHAVLTGYSETVDQEWPVFLANRYQKLCLELEVFLDKFPDKRAFDDDTMRKEIASVPPEERAGDIAAMMAAMRGVEGSVRFESALPIAIENVAYDVLPQGEIAVVSTTDQNGVELAIHADQFQSSNNSLKTLAANTESNEPFWKELSEQGNRVYAEEFAAGYLEGHKQAGAKDGVTAGKSHARVKIASKTGNVLSRRLSEKYPKGFGWLKRFGL